MDKELVEKATKLGLDANSFKSEDELKNAIQAKEEESKKKEDDDDSDPKIKKWKDEAKKAFDDRDEAKKERRKLQSTLDDMKNQLAKAPSQDEHDNLKKQVDELTKIKKEIDEQREQEELSKKTEVEKIQLQFKKEMDKFKSELDSEKTKWQKDLQDRETKLNEKDKEIESLRQVKLRTEIVEVAAKMKAYNPTQIYKLVKDDFTYEKDLDKFVRYVKDAKGKLTNDQTVEERIKEFLSDPENDNLVESGINTEGTSQKKGSETKSTVTVTSKTGKKYDPKDPKIVKQADFAGLSVDEYIETLKIRDERLAQRK